MSTPVRRILNGRYALLPNPKAGGMADVFGAADLDNAGQKVAVKLLPYLPEQNAIIAESFRRETDALRRLEHPNIVKMIEAGQDAETTLMRPANVLEFRPAEHRALGPRASAEIANR